MTGENDGRFPYGSAVLVRYPLQPGPEHQPGQPHDEHLAALRADREAWPWLEGTVEQQCGPDEWLITIEDRRAAVLDDGSPAPEDTPEDDLLHPQAYRDSSEMRAAPELEAGNERVLQPVPLENRIRSVICGSSGCQAARVLVDQAAQDGFSVDPFAVEVGDGEGATVVFAIGNALGDALVRPGRVVVRLVFGQDSAQMALPEDRHAVEELTAQVPTRRSQVAFIRGAWTAVRTILVPAAWKTASNEPVKFEPRSRIRSLMSSNRSPRLRARLRACCTVHFPVGFAVTPPRCIRRLPCSMNTSTYKRFNSTVSTCRKSTAKIPAAWACRN
jgi:hypothetical protein